MKSHIIRGTGRDLTPPTGLERGLLESYYYAKCYQYHVKYQKNSAKTIVIKRVALATTHLFGHPIFRVNVYKYIFKGTCPLLLDTEPTPVSL